MGPAVAAPLRRPARALGGPGRVRLCAGPVRTLRAEHLLRVHPQVRRRAGAGAAVSEGRTS
eukprot:8260934-Lingulodinium_polyedra.AAC.1